MLVLIAAAQTAAQKVQVTNWPTPVSTPAPTATPWLLPIAIPHVDVGWGTFWVTGVGLVIAIFAVVFAYKAFRAASDDLEISKETQRLASRKPFLQADFTLVEGGNNANFGNYTMFVEGRAQLRARVWNGAEGQRRCDAFLLELQVATADLQHWFLCDQVTGPVGDTYGFSKSSEALLFPGSEPTFLEFGIWFAYREKPRAILIKYRLKDDYQEYPKSGFDETSVELSARPRGLEVAPHDTAEIGLWDFVRVNLENFPGADVFKSYREGLHDLTAAGVIDQKRRMELAKDISKRIVAKFKGG
jgi:hypothetical protein